MAVNTLDACLFVRIAETLSFKEAASQLGLSRSAASKKIALLEKELGAMLINRSPRRITLTPAGEAVLGACRAICDAAQQAHSAIREEEQSGTTALTVSVPAGLGGALLPTLLAEFISAHPRIRLRVRLTEQQVDAVTSGYDVVIHCARKLADSNFSVQRLGVTRDVLVAAPAYLEKHGVPRHVRELSRANCLGFGAGANKATRWRFVGPDGPHEVPVTYVLSADSSVVLNSAACLGLGFLYVPEIYVLSELQRGRLKRVLPEFCQSSESGIYAIYPRRNKPAGVKAFVDFLRERLEALRSDEPWTTAVERAR